MQCLTTASLLVGHFTSHKPTFEGKEPVHRDRHMLVNIAFFKYFTCKNLLEKTKE